MLFEKCTEMCKPMPDEEEVCEYCGEYIEDCICCHGDEWCCECDCHIDECICDDYDEEEYYYNTNKKQEEQMTVKQKLANKKLDVKKEFPFLIPLVDHIRNGEYKEIADELDKGNIMEIISNDITRGEYELYQIGHSGKIVQSSYYDISIQTPKEGNKLEDFTFSSYRNTVDNKLTGLYLVKDRIAVDEYKLELEKQSEKKRLEDEAKHDKQRQESLDNAKSYIEDAKRFGLKRVDYHEVNRRRNAEKITEKLNKKEVTVEDLIDANVA